MRLAWHIVRKDLLRLRWILLLWAVVLAGGLGLGTIQFGLDGETYYPFWIATNVVVTGFLPLFAFGLVMGLLHDDPVAEIDAFWITRPISGGELLLAKALGLLLLSLVPVIVTLPFWLAHDLGVAQLGRAVREVLLGHFLIVAAALPFALVSANGSKFVMNVMLGAGGLLLLSLCLQMGSSRAPADDSSLVQSKAWLLASLWLATTLLMTWLQFGRRRLRQTLALAASAVVVGLAIASWWPRPLEFLRESAALSVPAVPRGTPFLSARIGDEVRQLPTVGQVALRDGAAFSRHGVTLKIQSVFVDFTGELQVSLSEAALLPARGLLDRLPGDAPRQAAPAHYFLFNPDDVRLLPVQLQAVGNGLETAAMRFTHAAIRVRPGNAWQPNAPADFKAWLQRAWLIKLQDTAPARISPP